MTAGELAKLLAELPPDTPVLVDGYEGGVKPPVSARVWDVMLDANDGDYCGPHEVVTEDGFGPEDMALHTAVGGKVAKAFVISRREQP